MDIVYTVFPRAVDVNFIFGTTVIPLLNFVIAYVTDTA